MSDARATTILRYVGANVRRLRLACGWTQKELAAASELNERSVQLLETGTANPTLKALIAVADALGVAPTDLFAVAKPEPRHRGRPPTT